MFENIGAKKSSSCSHEGDICVCQTIFEVKRPISECDEVKQKERDEKANRLSYLKSLDVNAEIAALESELGEGQ